MACNEKFNLILWVHAVCFYTSECIRKRPIIPKIGGVNLICFAIQDADQQTKRKTWWVAAGEYRGAYRGAFPAPVPASGLCQPSRRLPLSSQSYDNSDPYAFRGCSSLTVHRNTCSDNIHMRLFGERRTPTHHPQAPALEREQTVEKNCVPILLLWIWSSRLIHSFINRVSDRLRHRELLIFTIVN